MIRVRPSITPKLLVFSAIPLFAFAAPAHASYTLYTGAVAGFVSDSATSAYLAAQGTPTEFISFDTLADGSAAPDINPIDGSLFSSGVDFASAGSPLVNYSGPGSDSEIGPEDSGGYTGTLIITLATPATAVGFGTVSPDVTATFFDPSGTQVATYTTGDEFDFVGLVGSSGSEISTIDLSFNFFAIQDFQYGSGSAAAVPEAGTWAMMIVGLGAAGIAMRRRNNVSVAYA